MNADHIDPKLLQYFQKIHLPLPDSHKGQNGKVLVIGGSELFHAASRWSLDVASKCVDMVFYSSVPSNNELIKEAKGSFWNGIVVDRADVESYLAEADCILIGPGMTRSPETAELTNTLVGANPTKKWVIDAGALQMISSTLLTASCLVTPHLGEFKQLVGQTEIADADIQDLAQKFSQTHNQVCLVVKGQTDWIIQGETAIEITGGNGGMTKGGTGDVLAGLIAGLYATNDTLTSAIVGSYVNKRAGDQLFDKVGPYFNSSDLVQEIPPVLWQSVQAATSLSE
jgi:NAD(P)H-hydrate epimerase